MVTYAVLMLKDTELSIVGRGWEGGREKQVGFAGAAMEWRDIQIQYTKHKDRQRPLFPKGVGLRLQAARPVGAMRVAERTESVHVTQTLKSSMGYGIAFRDSSQPRDPSRYPDVPKPGLLTTTSSYPWSSFHRRRMLELERTSRNNPSSARSPDHS
jgi:hypothetical protein